MALTKLKIVILKKGLTQKAVAERAGIHESTLSQIARGTNAPHQKQNELISRAIDAETEELFENE